MDNRRSTRVSQPFLGWYGEGRSRVALQRCLADEMSATGVRITTHQPCPPGTELWLTLRLKGEHVTLRGRVVWCRPGPNAYVAGVELEEGHHGAFLRWHHASSLKQQLLSA